MAKPHWIRNKNHWIWVNLSHHIIKNNQLNAVSYEIELALLPKEGAYIDQFDSGLRYSSSWGKLPWKTYQLYGALILLWLHFNLAFWFFLWTNPLLLSYYDKTIVFEFVFSLLKEYMLFTAGLLQKGNDVLMKMELFLYNWISCRHFICTVYLGTRFLNVSY